MSLKNKPVQEVTFSLANLRKVDFKSGQSFHSKGFLPFRDLPRLVDEIQQKDPEFDVIQKGVYWEILTWADEQANQMQYRFSIHLSFAYPLECQRCLNNYEEEMQFTSQFLLQDTEEAVENFPLEIDHEDALLNSHQFDLIELFEDEVLLSLPLIPKHRIEQCRPEIILAPGIVNQSDSSPIAIEPISSAENPFLGLKKLKFDA
jgi:uncharacterized protein